MILGPGTYSFITPSGSLTLRLGNYSFITPSGSMKLGLGNYSFITPSGFKTLGLGNYSFITPSGSLILGLGNYTCILLNKFVAFVEISKNKFHLFSFKANDTYQAVFPAWHPPINLKKLDF